MLKDEMRWQDWLWLYIAAAMGLMAILAILPGYAKIGVWFSDNNAPAWVQAIGSVAAIFWAIWTVSREDARRRKQELALASLTAVAINRKVIAIHTFAVKWESILDIVAEPGDSVDGFSELLTRLADEAEKLVMPTSDEMKALIPAPDRAAKKLASVIGNFGFIVAHCRSDALRNLTTSKEQRLSALELKFWFIQAPEHTKEVLLSLSGLMNHGEKIEHWLI